MRRQPTMSAGIAILAIMVLISITGPLLLPNEGRLGAFYPPNKIHMDDRLEAPGSQFLFGSDDFGRDVFSRTLDGGRSPCS